MTMATETERFGVNLPNSVADVHVKPPSGWEAALRHISPKSDVHSYLIFYWYRSGERWVLYDVLPKQLINPKENQGAPITGAELMTALTNKPPRDLEPYEVCPYVSDVQHEMYRIYGGYARPFWVLQGDKGGHQVRFSPWQQNVLAAKRLPTEPPRIGSLPACPFDNRSIDALNHLNRLFEMEMSIERLKKSGSPEAARLEMERVQREIREAEMQFIESQMNPVVEMTDLIRRSSAHQEHVIYTAPGAASRAKDALDKYMETGVTE